MALEDGLDEMFGCRRRRKKKTAGREYQTVFLLLLVTPRNALQARVTRSLKPRAGKVVRTRTRVGKKRHGSIMQWARAWPWPILICGIRRYYMGLPVFPRG
jgi:hypothetical protein